MRANKIFYFIFFLFSMLVAFSSSRLYAEGLQSRVVNIANVFTLNLPLEWTEIPSSEIEVFSARVKNLNPRLKKQHYEFGLSRSGKKFFSYPYILVQIDRSGRVSEPSLEELVKSKRLTQLTGEQINSEFSNVLSKINSGETVYDSQNKIVWFSIVSEIKGVGEVAMLSASKLTKFGSINLYCYLLRGEHNLYAPVFEKLVEEMKVVPEFEW